MARAIQTVIDAGGHVSIVLHETPQALEQAADQLESSIVPPSTFDLGLLCAALMRRIAVLERARG